MNTRSSDGLSEVAKQTLILQCYEALRVQSEKMRELARAESWEALVQEESRYVVEVERLSRMERELELDEGQRERKAALLEAILESDREVRERLITRRDELGALIGASQRKRDLSRAYRTASGSAVVDAEHVFAAGALRDSEGGP